MKPLKIAQYSQGFIDSERHIQKKHYKQEKSPAYDIANRENTSPMKVYTRLKPSDKKISKKNPTVEKENITISPIRGEVYCEKSPFRLEQQKTENKTVRVPKID